MAPYSNIAKNILGLGGEVLDVKDVALEGRPPTYRDLLQHGVALCQQDPRMTSTELIKWVDIILEYAIFFCNGFGTIFLFNANKGRNQNLTVPSSILIRPKEKIKKKVIFLIDEEFTEGYFVDFFLRQFWMVSKNWKLKYEIF